MATTRKAMLKRKTKRMKLSDADRAVFLRAIARPPEPAPKLVKAMKRLRMGSAPE